MKDMAESWKHLKTTNNGKLCKEIWLYRSLTDAYLQIT